MNAAGGYPALVADLGGTHARFGWIAAPAAPISAVRTLRVADHPSPADALRRWLADCALPAPRRAAFAVASTLVGDEVVFTNSAWRFSRRALQTAFALDALLVLNDFEALALSLPALDATQLACDRALALPPTAMLAVVGPGTGLGVAGACPTPQGWIALPSEGGHVTLAAGDDAESALLARLRERCAHVSAERVLCGSGLELLHGAVCEVNGWRGEAASAAAIIARALAGSDAACVRTIDVFCALLGGFAGNVALTLGARGGVYLGGGIVPRLGETFRRSRFRVRFEAKGRYRDWLAAIPTPVITDTQAALAGAARALGRS